MQPTSLLYRDSALVVGAASEPSAYTGLFIICFGQAAAHRRHALFPVNYATPFTMCIASNGRPLRSCPDLCMQIGELGPLVAEGHSRPTVAGTVIIEGILRPGAAGAGYRPLPFTCFRFRHIMEQIFSTVLAAGAHLWEALPRSQPRCVSSQPGKPGAAFAPQSTLTSAMRGSSST